MPDKEEGKEGKSERTIERIQEREETEKLVRMMTGTTWDNYQAWFANIKKMFEDREALLNTLNNQDVTRRNAANALVDKMDSIFATNMSESLSIEREDRAARLAEERSDAKTKNLLFNNSHYYQMNWLYEFPEMWPFQMFQNMQDSRILYTSLYVDFLRKLADNIESKAQPSE
jgi:hypothetical protein